MQLTSDQQLQLQQAKAAGERRVHLQFTPAQRAEWQAAVQQEMATQPENLARVRKLRAAAEQPGFFGDIRRAINTSRRPLDQLAAEIGIDPTLLSDFRAGDAELPPAVLDRLLSELGLRLMQEIR